MSETPSPYRRAIGELGPARRHLARLISGQVPTSSAVLKEIAVSLGHCVARLEAMERAELDAKARRLEDMELEEIAAQRDLRAFDAVAELSSLALDLAAIVAAADKAPFEPTPEAAAALDLILFARDHAMLRLVTFCAEHNKALAGAIRANFAKHAPGATEADLALQERQAD